ncbi:hypothetical protein ACFL33_02370 [Pseudomonadota bacterium]|jgi:hypothetical protein|nr:hypothetical protein [Xanthomonadales bacterium]
MTLAALELNDQSLLVQAEDGALHAEPGFARLTREGIVTGEEARAVAWREPQHVYNQYWCHLSQAPLPSRHRFARHHADIAFAQLRKLWLNAGSPESLLVLAPGSFAHAQLALLLGMVEALPSQTAAVIDSALGSCVDVERDTLYVDLQMHQSVLTVCRPRGGSIRIVDQEIFPGLGMAQIQNSLARHISDLMIESYRFDPLHSSTTEQAIFDQIPHWLTRLRWEPDISIKLASEHGEHPCILRRDAVAALVGERLASVRSFLEKWQSCSLLLSHASAVLAGLVDEFAEAEVADQTAGTQRCLSQHGEILDQVDDLRRVRALYRIEPDALAARVPDVNGERLATHLLCGDRAMPLNKPVSIRIGENGPRISGELDDGAALTVVLRNRSLETLHLAADASLPPTCRPGESIRIGGHELKLIHVRHD